MNVFKPVITLSVILTVLLTSATASAQWGYRVDPPIAPNITRTKTLHNPTISQIQDAIQPNTQVKVFGNVDASTGQILTVYFDDVRLDFSKANQIQWRGGDSWAGFISICAERVEIRKLRVNIVGPGRCRGIMLYDPCRDIYINNCEFRGAPDGLVADGSYTRILIENTGFLDCGNFQNVRMEGGYGMFFQDNDWEDDHVHLKNVTITMNGNATQHGLRISGVQRMLIEDSSIGANEKRSLWAYGVDRLAIRNSTFHDGSLLFGLMDHEFYNNRPMSRVRLDTIRIYHTGILQPIGIRCSKGTTNFRMRNLDIHSTSSREWWLALHWRHTGYCEKIRWRTDSIRYNGQMLNGWSGTWIDGWTDQEHLHHRIGPFPFPR
jgi:hypothetical protein